MEYDQLTVDVTLGIILLAVLALFWWTKRAIVQILARLDMIEDAVVRLMEQDNADGDDGSRDMFSPSSKSPYRKNSLRSEK